MSANEVVILLQKKNFRMSCLSKYRGMAGGIPMQKLYPIRVFVVWIRF